MSEVWVIAEIGVNHNGNIELAKKMIEEAKKAGVDAVKFQTFQTKALVSGDAIQAAYQIQNMQGEIEHPAIKGHTQYTLLKQLELSKAQFYELKAYCQYCQVDFLSSPFDLESIDFLETLGISKWKIPSGELTNLPYLIKIAKTGQPILLSTGMSTLEEVRRSIEVLGRYGAGEVTLLHCNTAYPTPYEDVHLSAMQTLKETFQREVGYSDHTQGIEVPIAAVALGATVIEKHFTLDKKMKGPDHKASIDPIELAQMVESIRHIEKALGKPEKKPSSSETANLIPARKSIVATRTITKGEIFTEENLAVKRPGDGMSPMRWFDVIGEIAKRDFHPDERIEL